MESLECCAKEYDFLLEALGCSLCMYIFFTQLFIVMNTSSQEMSFVLDSVSFLMEHRCTAGKIGIKQIFVLLSLINKLQSSWPFFFFF